MGSFVLFVLAIMMKLVVTFVCLLFVFAVCSQAASVADESLNSEDASKFLNRMKRDLWEECVNEGCTTHEVWETMEHSTMEQAEEKREFIFSLARSRQKKIRN